MKKWYEELFNNYAVSYDKKTFTRKTSGEVDFIEKEINYNRSTKILDIGCGTGQHALELTRRGYKVTGIDLSESQIKKAKEKAESEGLSVEFLQKDACDLHYCAEFSLVTMLCEGAFPLMETDELNYQILKNAANALVSKGKFIFTTLNGLFPLFHPLKDFINGNFGMGKVAENAFDLMTLRDRSTFEVCDDSGNKRIICCDERYYVPSEITWYLKSLDFSTIEIFGCGTGDFRRGNPLTTEDFEMLVVAIK